MFKQARNSKLITFNLQIHMKKEMNKIIFKIIHKNRMKQSKV